MGNFTPLQRCSQCILQLQPTGPLVGGGPYPSAEMQSVYSTTPSNWATRWRGLISLERCNRCILQLQRTGPIVWGMFYFSAEMQSIYSTTPANWATLWWRGGSYFSAEMQSMYSTTSANWATLWSGLLSLQGRNQCILPFQRTGLSVSVCVGVLFLCWDGCSRCILQLELNGLFWLGFIAYKPL